ncbi:hypothetical protein [Thermogemmatispora tikiterensis]|uniref:Uncharacterized protein n=1 Tax=Thermogemmatispora tikiterensis TaxID=1825093 RepID=A0A328VK50_9CHLR|nr:hypothetical protein [Thermogemmatispora tikiterensis]RAQ97479.1 hypothetical protein A4R35_18215 [Thermogemmatispora tikiterensis]
MQHHTSLHCEPTLSERLPLTIGLVGGAITAAGQFLLLFTLFFDQLGLAWAPELRLLMLLGLWLGLPGSLALLLASLIARCTGVRDDGYTVGGTTGCIAALLTTVGSGVWLVITIVSMLPATRSPLIDQSASSVSVFMPSTQLLEFYIVLIFINLLSFLLALLGGIIGGHLGSTHADAASPS